ncbi:MAG: hypothetical protein U0903_00230 [Planctomycetales bacterium]
MVSWSALKPWEKATTRGNDPPAPYEVRCRCSHVTKGVRIPLVQRIRCEECGHPLFILPVSVYPLPGASTKGSKGKKGKRKKKKGAPAVSTGRVMSIGQMIVMRCLGICAFPFIWLWRQILLGMQRTLAWLAKPLHAVAIGLIVVVAGTGYWSALRWQQSAAREVLAKVPAEAEKLLHDRKIADAAEELKKLDKAVRVLGRNDSAGVKWKQWAAEARAAVNLAPGSVLELINEGEEYRSQPTAKWKRVFDLTYRGTWMILDSTALVPGNEGPRRVETQMRIRGKQVFLSADVSRQEWRKRMQGEKRIICAAKLDKCFQESDGVWKIEFDPNAVILMTNPDVYAFATLATLDTDRDEDLEKQLARQGEIVGVTGP